MRYSHRYFLRRTRRHRRGLRLAGFGWLILGIAIVAATVRLPASQAEIAGFFGTSIARITVAYLLSLIIGVGVGLLAISSTWLENLLLPILDVAQSFPSFALLPILVYRFGHGSLSVVIILLFAMVWPIAFAVIGGVKEQRRDQAEAAKIFGATGWKFFRFYRWPMLRPSLVSGSIVSVGEAWDVLVGAEIIAGVTGAGSFLGNISQNNQASQLALGVLLYLLVVFTLNQIIWLPMLHKVTQHQSET